MTRGRRALLLMACLGAGSAVGAIGFWLTGSSGWALAIPAAVAAGWIWVADPTQCVDGPADRRSPPPR
jgi:hypothetical protein